MYSVAPSKVARLRVRSTAGKYIAQKGKHMEANYGCRITKNDFIREGFRELLADGQPHRYKDIAQYIQARAEGTIFDGCIGLTYVGICLKPLLEQNNAEYEKVSHGYYRKIPACTKRTRLIERMLNSHTSLLDSAFALQREMVKARQTAASDLSDMQAQLDPAYQQSIHSLDECIDGIAALLAALEDETDFHPLMSDSPDSEAISAPDGHTEEV